MNAFVKEATEPPQKAEATQQDRNAKAEDW